MSGTPHRGSMRGGTRAGGVPMHHSKRAAARLERCIGTPPAWVSPLLRWASERRWANSTFVRAFHLIWAHCRRRSHPIACGKRPNNAASFTQCIYTMISNGAVGENLHAFSWENRAFFVGNWPNITFLAYFLTRQRWSVSGAWRHVKRGPD